MRPVVKHDIDDDVRISTRTDGQLEQAILDALQAGPLMKWELRVQLHERETRIFRHLRTLRIDGRIRTVNHVRARRYALPDWQPTGEESFDKPRIVRPGVADLVPTSSWWTEVDSRESFARRLEVELPRMTKSSVLPGIRPMLLGGKLP